MQPQRFNVQKSYFHRQSPEEKMMSTTPFDQSQNPKQMAFKKKGQKQVSGSRANYSDESIDVEELLDEVRDINMNDDNRNMQNSPS